MGIFRAEVAWWGWGSVVRLWRTAHNGAAEFPHRPVVAGCGEGGVAEKRR